MKRVFVTGASGFLGWNFCRAAVSHFETFGLFGRQLIKIEGVKTLGCDLTDFHALKKTLAEIEPDAIVHTAALANPNLCQTQPQTSYRINVEASQNIAGLCADRQIPCLYTSSDLVFDGRKPPYVETDPVSPVCIYGEHKVAAEQGIKRCYPKATICRMALMFGSSPETAQSFIQPMLADLENGRTVNLFVDEFRTPMGVKTAVAGLMLALAHPGTTLHLGGDTSLSRHELGLLTADGLGLSKKNIKACRSAEIPMAAPRSADVSLDTTKARALGFKPIPLATELQTLKNSTA